MLIEQTITKLNQMKLYGMVKAVTERIAQPSTQDLSVSEFLGLVVDEEYLDRENRRMSARLRGAKFKDQACLENIDYRADRSLKKSQMMEISNLDWITKKQNVAFTGPSGVGKSYLAQALGNAACRRGYRVSYLRLPKLVTALEQVRANGTYAQFLARLVKANVLILDDLAVGELKDTERRDLLEIIEDRYGVGSTVITSQLHAKDWHAYFGGGRLADSICDRLVHNCHRIELTGPSERKGRAKLD
jgi:DNA replication protein DnaC